MRNTFNRAIVLTALFFMVCELAYVNAKSLLFIVDEFGIIDKVFAVIGSLAFSLVTVIIMRRGQQRWLKFVFPIFDTALVFCGFNLKFANALTANWVALSLTAFMALFTGLITYSLGTISYHDSEKSKNNSDDFELQVLKGEMNSLEEDIKTLLSEKELLHGQLINCQSKCDGLYTEIDKYKNLLAVKKGEYELLKSECEKYKAGYMAAERSRILKKAEKNRTEEELEILKMTV